ncbi:MAG: hypothetical protein KGS72_06690 [Cyanobacteria bacterium REEB67]|nr:hypothetical protein [Cyanobacteria bacterium REEB67]
MYWSLKKSERAAVKLILIGALTNVFIIGSSVVAYAASSDESLSASEAPLFLTLHDASPVLIESGPGNKANVLTGGVQQCTAPELIGAQLDLLLDSSLGADRHYDDLTKSVAHYRTTSSKVVTKTKEAVNVMVPYRGCGPSRAAADVILDEKPVDPTDAESAAYSKQRVVDEAHPAIVRAVLQVAEAYGQSEALPLEPGRDAAGGVIAASKPSSKMERARLELADLVGIEQADKTIALIGSVSRRETLPANVFKSDELDMARQEELVRELTNRAMKSDPVVAQLKKRLHKYSDHSYLAEKFSGLVQGSMSVISVFGPGFFIPTAAEAVSTSYIMATGGKEDDKLLKSIYFDKRLESRWRTVNKEATMSVSAYDRAIRHKNKTLLIASQSIMVQLVGEENIAALNLPWTSKTVSASISETVR